METQPHDYSQQRKERCLTPVRVNADIFGLQAAVEQRPHVPFPAAYESGVRLCLESF
jgi:hypothetical protein